MDKNLAEKPVVSIVMPAYNAAAYIKEAIASVQAQTYSKWELIVVDDGSTDDTTAIVKSSDLPKTKLRYIHTKNGGPGVARNRGIKQAKGELIAFLDADDTWEPAKLELQVAAQKAGGYDLVFSSGRFIGSPTDEPFVTAKGPFSGPEMFAVLYQHNRIPIVSVLVRQAALAKVGGFKEDGLLSRKCEEYDLWLRLADAGCTFLGMPEKLVGYRLHADSHAHQTAIILEGDLAAVSQFSDTVRKQDPDAYRRRLTDIYNRLTAAQAAAGNLNAARRSLTALAAFENPAKLAGKRLALTIFGRRYNAWYYRVLKPLS